MYLFRDLAEQESLRRHQPCVSEISSLVSSIEGKRDFLRTVTPALLTGGLRIEGGI